MSLTSYKLTSSSTGNKLDGFIRISFEDGLLKSFELHIKKPLTEWQFSVFIEKLPYEESRLNAYQSLGLVIEKETASNDKIALFCRMYEKYIEVKYKVSAADSGKIRLINPTEDVMKHYFESENFLFKNKYSISNLVKYWNELQAEISRGPASRFPNRWDSDFFRKLGPAEISEYWKHLHSLGLKPVKNSMGNTVDWK